MFEITGSELLPFDRKYKGILIQQSKHIPSVFIEFFKKIRPSRILEIGSSRGGLSMFMEDALDYLNIECDIISVDIKNNGQSGRKVKFVIENIFDDDYFLKNREYSNFIESPGVSVVICDGGKKVKEFNELSKFLKDGDFIMAHDYAENHKVFVEKIKGKIWNCLEITEKSISECSQKHNLFHFMQEEMAKIAWVCKQKCPRS